MLLLLDGLKARDLLGRAQLLTVSGCSLELSAVALNPRVTTQEADRLAKEREQLEEELRYGSS